MLRRIGIRVNTAKDTDFSVTKMLSDKLRQFDFEPVLYGEAAAHFGLPAIDEISFLSQCDAVFVLGGDGTMLDIIANAAMQEIPIMGINMGRIGFLTEIEVNELDHVLQQLRQGEYYIEERMMLQCAYKDRILYALNEFAVHRAVYECVIHLEICAGEYIVDGFFADGVIVASPTGSTGYSLSAGGPILAPTIHAILLTPICAHTLRSRPMVLDDQEIITIKTLGVGDASIMYDGKELALKSEKINIQIKRAPFKAQFLRVKHSNFYKLLEMKLNEWSVPQN
ncbi:MAG: NAD(+)/NADH kinase [Clostridiales bacterium]|nr:NAD(+)/NADH kinase [Clostridiales bacterium]